MTTRVQLIDEVNNALTAFTSIELWGPNREDDIPDPGPVTAPVSWGAWNPAEEEYDEDSSTFRVRIYRGTVDFVLLTQKGAGELDYAGYATSIENLLRAVTTATVHFFPATQGDVVEDETWSGRILSVPYLREEAV